MTSTITYMCFPAPGDVCVGVALRLGIRQLTEGVSLPHWTPVSLAQPPWVGIRNLAKREITFKLNCKPNKLRGFSAADGGEFLRIWICQKFTITIERKWHSAISAGYCLYSFPYIWEVISRYTTFPNAQLYASQKWTWLIIWSQLTTSFLQRSKNVHYLN